MAQRYSNVMSGRKIFTDKSESIVNVFYDNITPRPWSNIGISTHVIRAEAITNDDHTVGYGISNNPIYAYDRAGREAIERVYARCDGCYYDIMQNVQYKSTYPDVSLGVASAYTLHEAKLKGRMELIEKTSLHILLNDIEAPYSWVSYQFILGSYEANIINSLEYMGYTVKCYTSHITANGVLACAYAYNNGSCIPILFGSSLHNSILQAVKNAIYEMLIELADLQFKLMKRKPLIPFSHLVPFSKTRNYNRKNKSLYSVILCEDIPIHYGNHEEYLSENGENIYITRAMFSVDQDNPPIVADYYWEDPTKIPFDDYFSCYK